MNESTFCYDPSLFLNKKVRIEIDRPLGSKHPHYNTFYKVNYGFIPGIISGDGKELDAYVIGINRPLKTYEGYCIAILKRLNQDDDKLIIVPEGQDLSNQEIYQAINFIEQYYQSKIIRKDKNPS